MIPTIPCFTHVPRPPLSCLPPARAMGHAKRVACGYVLQDWEDALVCRWLSAREARSDGIAGFHIRLALCVLDCLYACVLVCLFARLTRHPPFNNAQPSDPTLTLSCYPGVLLFLLACAGRFACSLWKGTARRCLPCLRSARVSPACVPEARRK